MCHKKLLMSFCPHLHVSNKYNISLMTMIFWVKFFELWEELRDPIQTPERKASLALTPVLRGLRMVSSSPSIMMSTKASGMLFRMGLAVLGCYQQ